MSHDPGSPVDLPWGSTWPVLEVFRDLAATRRVIPVVRRLLADEITPVGLYRTLGHGRPDVERRHLQTGSVT